MFLITSCSHIHNEQDLDIDSQVYSSIARTNLDNNTDSFRVVLATKISNEEVSAYIKQDNYKNSDDEIYLENILKNPPKEWDLNADNIWNGYMPDCHFNFDDEGFDLDAQGNYTFWKAYEYHTYLGTFLTTNESKKDVLIRLPQAFYTNENDDIDMRAYKLNIAIVKSLIKKEDIQIPSIHESIYGVDLNQNGYLDIASKVVFKWNPPQYDLEKKIYYNYSMYFVGQAKQLQEEGSLKITPGLYPKNAEFLYSLRYIDFDTNESTNLSKRMKELRYAKKITSSEGLQTISGNAEEGLSNGLGWIYQGFIEDIDGYLRPQTYEENLKCIGCHNNKRSVVDFHKLS